MASHAGIHTRLLLVALPLAAGVLVADVHRPVDTVSAAGGSGCGGVGYPAPYNVACNPTVAETSAPGVNRLAGGVIPTDTVYCNTSLFAACAATVASNPGASGVQVNYLPTDVRTAAEQQIERDIADAINYERTQRGMTPLVLSENLTKIGRRYIEMFESDTGLTRNGTITDCPFGPYLGCDSPAYADEALLINQTSFSGWSTEQLFHTPGGSMAGASSVTPGDFVRGLVCGSACAGSTDLHRKAVLTNAGTYLAGNVKCGSDGKTYMVWAPYARGVAVSTASPSDYEAGGGSDIAPKVSVAFGHRCPQPAPSFSSVTGGDGASVVASMTSAPSGLFLQACAASPAGPAVLPAGGLTVSYTLRNQSSVVGVLSYQSTGAAASMYQSKTFSGLAPGVYSVTAVVSGCAGESIPVVQSVTVPGGSSTTVPGGGGGRVGAGLVPVAPVRDVDTRSGLGGGRLAAGVPVRLLLGHVPVSASGATLNVTAVSPAAGGFLSVFPCASGVPATSSVNFAAGQTVAAQVSVGVAAGEVCVVSSVSADVLVDVNGYFVGGAGAGFVSASRRLADTRPATLPAGGVLEVDVSSFAPADAVAVSVNVVGTQTAEGGFLTVFPCGGAVPVVSNLNFAASDTGANHATVLLPASKRVCVFSSARSSVVVDLTGWWTSSAAGGFVGAVPSRVVDTRSGLGGPVFVAGEERQLMPAAASVYALTVTAAPAGVSSADGWLAVFPCGAGYQGTSTLNFRAGSARAAAVLIDGASGVCVKASTAVNVLIDQTGTLR